MEELTLVPFQCQNDHNYHGDLIMLISPVEIPPT